MDTADVERGAQRVKSAATEMGGGLRSSLGGLMGIATATAALIGVSTGIRSIVDNTVRVNSMIEQATARYRALGSSTEDARKRVESLMNFSRTTPFETQSIINAAEKLRLLGGAALDNNKYLKLFGDAAAATGQPIDSMATMMGRLYQSIQNGEPVQRFSTRLERMGVLTPEVTKKLIEMQKAHASGAQMWDLVTTSMGRFNGAMDQQLGTWEGLNTAIHRTVADLEATAFRPLFQTMEGGLIRLNQWLNTASVQRAAVAFGQGLANAIQGIAKFIGTAWAFLATDPATKPLRDFFGTIARMISNFFSELGKSGNLFAALGAALDAIGDPGRHAHDVLGAMADVLAPRLRIALQAVVPLMWSAVAAFTAFSLVRGVVSMISELEQVISRFVAGLRAGGLVGGLAGALGLSGLGPIGLAIAAVVALASALTAAYVLFPQVRAAANNFFRSFEGVAPIVGRVWDVIVQLGRAIGASAQTIWPVFMRILSTVGDTFRQINRVGMDMIGTFLGLFLGFNNGGQSVDRLGARVRTTHSILAAMFAFLAIYVPQSILTFFQWIRVAADAVVVVADAVLGTAVTLWDAGHGRISQALEDIKAVHHRMGDDVRQVTADIGTAWNSTTSFLDGRILQQMNDFAGNIDAIFNQTGTASRRGTRTAQEAYAAMQQDLQRKQVLIQKNADDIANAVPRAMAAARQATVNSVSDTMSGFLRGLQSFLGPVTVTAGQIASAVPKEVSQRGQAHSPSRVMFDIGQDYGEGYRLGLVNSLSRLTAVARQGVQGVIGAFGTQPAALAATSLRLNTSPGLALAAASAGAGPVGAVAPVNYDIDQHFYESDLQPSDISSEIGWLMKTRRRT